MEILELFYEDVYKEIKNVYIHGDKSIGEFLKTNYFDFYIFDSLDDFAKDLILNSGLSKEKVPVELLFLREKT